MECKIFDGLGIPYRVIDTATGDLGGPAYRKFDLEAWMPGRGKSGEYGEVTSTSNCTDYQARRLNIRYKVKGEKGTNLVHTLNGTAVAISRALIAILENYQQADGSIVIPEVLRKWVGKERIGSEEDCTDLESIFDYALITYPAQVYRSGKIFDYAPHTLVPLKSLVCALYRVAFIDSDHHSCFGTSTPRGIISSSLPRRP